MIYVLKHKETKKYIKGAFGKMVPDGLHTIAWTGSKFVRIQGQPVFEWNGNKSGVKFTVTDNMLEAQQIEDPDMQMVVGYGLEAVPLKFTKGTIERAYTVYERGD